MNPTFTNEIHLSTNTHANPQSYPSIFNDVIGPVMRGPSSSHCAAALRIGRLARDLMGGDLTDVLVQYDPNGSLATTHESQGSHMGLCGGLLDWDADDARLVTSPVAIGEAGINIEVEIVAYGAAHPNTYRLALGNAVEQHTMVAISTGGGAIEVLEIDGVKVSMFGDFHETLLYLGMDARAEADQLVDHLSGLADVDSAALRSGSGRPFIEVRSLQSLTEKTLDAANAMAEIQSVKTLAPVLPVLSRADLTVPFITCEQMLAYNEDKGLELWELAIDYECARGAMSRGQVVEQMAGIVAIMRAGIEQGIAGTDYADRILGRQAGNFQALMEGGSLIEGGALNRMILYTTAMMETKSSMGVIVAAPTAGACGALPGAVLGATDVMGLSAEEATRAMLAAGMIGVFIAAHATFAAEVGGCQAECGSGSGMAAAALVTLAGGSTAQAIGAASMALQSTLGMICDPVANRVEVPCLGRNVLAASNALSCANMALAGFDHVIPLDEVIETADRVGKSMPCELRCTALGGLAITPTSKRIELELTERKPAAG